MAHYAKIVDGIVKRIIVAEQDFIDTQEGKWVKTSYNMKQGIYYDVETNAPAADQSVINGDEARERKNYAVEGGVYDSERDIFLPEKSFPSWVIDETKWGWKAPVDKPDDGKNYFWNEETKSWDQLD